MGEYFLAKGSTFFLFVGVCKNPFPISAFHFLYLNAVELCLNGKKRKTKIKLNVQQALLVE